MNNLYIYIYIFRYLTLLYTAMHSLRNKSSFSKDKNWVYRQESDICMLHLFESFMGAAPQLILQLYIIAILNYAPLWTSKCSLHHSYKCVIKCLISYFTYYVDIYLNVNIKVRCNYKGFKINKKNTRVSCNYTYI